MLQFTAILHIFAEQFAEMLRNKGVENVVITDLSRCDIAEAVEDAFRYDRMVLAAQVMMQVYFRLCRIFFIIFRQKHFRTEQ